MPDVIIIGGSYAGLSAAMALGRSLRSVLIIDGGMPCNRQTPYSHNFITHDGEKPAEITRQAKEQVLKYETVKFANDFAVSGSKSEDGFTITTQSGKTYYGRKLIFATGIKDIMPNIKGFAECWGISAVHCPYCHGYELRSKKTGIMANGDKAFHLASLVNNLTNDLTILTRGKSTLTNEQTTKLESHGIQLLETDISEIQHDQGQLNKVIFSHGESMTFDGIYAALPFEQNTDIPIALGCELTEEGFISTDMFQKTTVDGVYACGDNSIMMRSVASAVASGNLAGAMVNMHLTAKNF